jgi:hypothetical protein
MKMNIQINIKDLGRFLDSKVLRRNWSEFFSKRLQSFALALMFLLTLFLIFLWYNFIFHSEWNEAQVNEYTQAKQSKNEAVFNRENFDKIVEESNARSAEFEKLLENLEDIFRLNK